MLKSFDCVGFPDHFSWNDYDQGQVYHAVGGRGHHKGCLLTQFMHLPPQLALKLSL